MVKVLVGPKKKEYHVHRGLLAHHSTFFKAALYGDWAETHSQTITLDKDTTEVFDAVYSWLYTRRLYHPAKAKATPSQCQVLCKIYVFGEARGAPAICNAATDYIIAGIPTKGLRYLSLLESIPFLYENTVPGSNLRRLFLHAFQNCRGIKEDDRKKFGVQDFFIDLILEFANSRCSHKDQEEDSEEEVYTDTCQFHDHLDPHVCFHLNRRVFYRLPQQIFPLPTSKSPNVQATIHSKKNAAYSSGDLVTSPTTQLVTDYKIAIQ